jgi:uncharacterized protein YkwD
MHRRHVPAVVALAALLLGLGVAGPAEAATATSSLDRSDKAQITAAYEQLLAPSLRTPVGWTGSIAGCRAGTVSAAQQAATLRVVNLARRLAGLSTVTLDPALSAKAQQAALVYLANDRLSHSIPTSWRCSTKAARQAGSHSDITLGAGATGAKAIALYLDDPGSSNLDAGHRRWVLAPAAKAFGSGSTTASNALWVIGPERAPGTYADPAWVSWPTPGYFPKQLEPEGLWSLSSGGSAKVDFSRATVTVVRAGKRLPVTVHTPVAGYGQPTLVWTVRSVTTPSTGLSAVYTVTVKGVKKAGRTVSHRYSVRLYDPTKVR